MLSASLNKTFTFLPSHTCMEKERTRERERERDHLQLSCSVFCFQVGGVKEKVLAAHRAGIFRVIIPRRNEKDLHEIPTNIRVGSRFLHSLTADSTPIILPCVVLLRVLKLLLLDSVQTISRSDAEYKHNCTFNRHIFIC